MPIGRSVTQMPTGITDPGYNARAEAWIFW